MRSKQYKFQAFVTAGHHDGGKPTKMPGMPPGQIKRMAVRGEHHTTHGSQFFSALVTNTGDGAGWLDDNHAIVTVLLTGEDPGEYFGAGDHFSLWLGGDVADGIVTRRLFV